jgi:PAS domain S-box-containing protein
MRTQPDLSPLHYGWKPLLSALLMLLAGLSLTAYSLHVTRQANRDTALMAFNQYVDRLEAAVQTRFREPLYGIRGAIGAQASTNTSGAMKRANFQAYVAARDIATEFPGIRGFGYIERVQRPDMARFEAAEKHDQSPFFRIKTHGNANELYVIKYLEPLAGNEAAIGLDLGAEAVRREAVERAIDTGEPSLSGVISLVQDNKKGPGFLYLVPVFADGTTPDTPQNRRALLIGLFYSPLTAHELLHSTRTITHGDIDFEIYDGATASPDTLVFSSQPSANNAAAITPTNLKTGRTFSDVRGLVIGGRLLTLRSGSSALFEAEHNAANTWWVGAGGSVLSLLLAFIVWLLLVGRTRAETLAHAMTADLGRLVETQKSTNEQLTRAMRESQSLLQAIDQHSLVSITNPAGDITYVNDLFCVISGYRREELMGQNHRFLQSNVQPAEFWHDMWHTIASAQVWRGVVCNQAKNGTLYWVNTVISPFFDDNGIEKYISIRTDITAARTAQLELATERERLSHIILGTRTGTWEWNVQTDAFVINERWADILGYALPELNPVSLATWHDRCHPDDLIQTRTLLAQHIEGDLGYYEQEIRMRHRDGHWVWVQERGKIASWSANGQPQWMSGTHMDISERKNAAAQLSEQLQFVEVLLEATPTAIYIKDQAGRYLRFNHAFEALFEIDRADWIGKTVFDLVPGESAALMHAKDLDLLATGTAQVYEATFTQHRSAVILEGHYCKAALRNNEGRITGLVGTITDVTERNRTARELLIAKNEAEAATIAKSQFLANMSHEIRTPMNAILGMLKLLHNTELTPRQLDYTSKTEGAAKSLLGLLNDILDFSKMDAAKMALDLQPFRVDQLIRDLTVIVSANLGNKPVVLRFDIDPAAPQALIGDAMRLQQVLINLSGNAIKFTAKGEVVIQIKQLAQTATDATLRFSVQDSGIGIATDKLAHIFTGFSQAEASTTRRFGGTGLGLSISRQLVALMGGELAVDSVLGQGSTFYFTLTLPTTELLPDDLDVVIKTPAITQRRLEGMRLLVVEDNLINQQVAQELLSTEGALIDIAANGQLGVEAVAAARPPFDAVLMDLQMPVMDGYAATRAIRTELGMTDLPIIAMTANVMASDRAACLAAGMNDHVGKPFNLPQLIKLLQTVTHHAPGATVVTSPSDPVKPETAPAPTEADDVASALERLGGNTDLYARILRDYLREITHLPDQLDRLLHDGDLASAARLLHTLKGLSATVGASHLASVAREAEAIVKNTHADAARPPSEWHARFRTAVLNTGRTMGEIARKLTQASVPADSPKAALDLPRLLAQLRELQGLLKRSDMRAMDVHAQLDSTLAQIAPEAFSGLNAAMLAFDFALGVIQCENLIQKLSLPS